MDSFLQNALDRQHRLIKRVIEAVLDRRYTDATQACALASDLLADVYTLGYDREEIQIELDRLNEQWADDLKAAIERRVDKWERRRQSKIRLVKKLQPLEPGKICGGAR